MLVCYGIVISLCQRYYVKPLVNQTITIIKLLYKLKMYIIIKLCMEFYANFNIYTICTLVCLSYFYLTLVIYTYFFRNMIKIYFNSWF